MLSGLARTLVSAPVYRNILAALVTPSQASTFLAVTAEDRPHAETALKRRLRGVISAMKPVDWTIVPQSELNASITRWSEAQCGEFGEARRHFASQLLSMREGFRLLKRSEQRTGIQFDVIIRSRPDQVFEHLMPDEMLQLAAVAPFRALIFCIQPLVREPAVFALVCPGADGFAILGRLAAQAYFDAWKQLDCTSSSQRLAACQRQPGNEKIVALAGAPDCLAPSRRWCQDVPLNSIGIDTVECRLSHQLHEQGVCVCHPHTERAPRIWTTAYRRENEPDGPTRGDGGRKPQAKASNGSAGTVWLRMPPGWHRPLVGYADIPMVGTGAGGRALWPLRPLRNHSIVQPRTLACCWEGRAAHSHERPDRLTRPALGFLNLS